MFTEKTMFTGDIFIANLEESCNGLPFFEWIEMCDEQCLRITLGDDLYDELLDQVVFNEDQQKYILAKGVDEKWDWLLNGHKYSKSDIQSQSFIGSESLSCNCLNYNYENYTWKGIVSTLDRRIPETTINGQTANGVRFSKSYLAYYAYWLWSLTTETTTTSTGEKKLKNKGGYSVTNTHKRVAAYNNFVSWVADCRKGSVGLYRFMHDFKHLFPNWEGQFLSYESVI